MLVSDETIRLAKIEKAKRLLFERYQKDPLFWLEHRFGEDRKSFQWSAYAEQYDSHVWDGDKDPLASAWIELANGNWASIESATGIGKTYLLARVVFWFLDCFENSLVVTTAPKESQLKLHLWTEIGVAFPKFKKIRPYSGLFSLRLIVDTRELDLTKETDNTEGWQAVGFVSGVGADEASATKAQGFHREHMLIVIEEMPGVGTPIMTAFENTSTGEHNLIFGLGNPDNETDTLHTFSLSENVKNIRASALDFPNVVLQKDIVKGATGLTSIERRKEKYGEESNFYKSRVRGISPAQSIDSAIMLKWILACIKEDFEPIGNGALGIDVANSDFGDKASLAWGKGNALIDLQEFQCPNATHLAYNLLYDDFALIQKGYENYKTAKLQTYSVKPEYVGIDTVGVGVATINAFKDKGKKVVSLQGGQLLKAIPKDNEGKPLYSFGSLRSQVYWELREDFRLGKLVLSLKDKMMLKKLISELVIPKYTIKNGKIQIEKKEEIKKRLGHSPNLSDAVAYWNWVRKGYYKEKTLNLPFGI